MRATRVSLIARHLISSTITTPTTTTRSLVTAKVLVAISSPSFSTTWTPLIRTTAAKMAPPQLVLYTMNTPNGVKVSIALEELGLPYEIKNIDISTGIQKEPWFLEINPNGRIPALTDKSFGDGKDLHVFESGAILQYLADTYDPDHKLSFPKGTREYWQVQAWLFFQNAGVGPMQGQANHFFRYAPEKIPYGIKRYIDETRRLYSVLQTQIQKNGTGYLVGDKLTIADIANFGWVRSAGWSGVDIDEFPVLKEWEERIDTRAPVKKGLDVPTKDNLKERIRDKAAAEKAEAETKAWIHKKM